MQTPWGQTQHITKIAEGISSVSTASHGGIKLDAKRNAAMPEYMRKTGGWYEEDCDWALPFVVFERDILAFGETWAVRAITEGAHHKSTMLNWHPVAYEKFFDVCIVPGASFIREHPLPAQATG